MGYAFATTGAVLGIIIALVVGATNVYTCRLLIRGAQYTGTRDYESFAYAVGGRWFKVRSDTDDDTFRNTHAVASGAVQGPWRCRCGLMGAIVCFAAHGPEGWRSSAEARGVRSVGRQGPVSASTTLELLRSYFRSQ